MIYEICCGSYEDALQASRGGAERIELNTALHLGGLTPTIASVKLTRENTSLKIISMVRPRAGGFHYTQAEKEQMFAEAELLLEYGSHGLAFGFLHADATVDVESTKKMTALIHAKGGEAVFHRAFDCVKDPYEAIEQLIAAGVDRILTSGLAPKAVEGKEMLRSLQEKYGNQIELLAGCGVNASNVREIIADTGLTQAHSSCKDWREDPTTCGGKVSYSFAQPPHASCYDIVSEERVRELVQISI